MIGVFIKGLLGIGGNWLQGRQELSKAKQDFKLAELENKSRLMRSQQEYNSLWEMTALKQTGKELKWISFVMLCAPIVLTMFGQYIGFDSAIMWKSLETVPVWWQNTFIGANATIWGTLQIRDMGGLSGIVNAFRKPPESKGDGNGK